MLESVASVLYSETHSQRCIGCDRRASDLLCRACFEAVPQIGRPVCARCGMPTAFETFVCDDRKGVDFSFESARAPLRRRDVGKQMVYSVKYRYYTRVVDRLAVPLMLSALDDQSRFDAVVPVSLHRSRLSRRGFPRVQPGATPSTGRRQRDKSTCFGYNTSRAQDAGSGGALGRREEGNVSGAYRARGRGGGRVLLIDDVFTTDATMSSCAETLLWAGTREVHALSLCRTC
jgi:competence protein ComFC